MAASLRQVLALGPVDGMPASDGSMELSLHMCGVCAQGGPAPGSVFSVQESVPRPVDCSEVQTWTMEAPPRCF